MKTKPFNKERAIAGDPVVDTTGQRWEFVEEVNPSKWPIKFRQTDNPDNAFWFTKKGNICDDNIKHDYDISMLDTTP